MKRLLCIVGRMEAGGAETFLMKLYRTMDRREYQFDFCVTSQESGHYDNEINKLGGKILYNTPKSKNPIRSFLGIMNIVKKEKYLYVMRVSQHSLSSLELLAAKLGGAKVLIYRSSNSSAGGYILKLLHYLFRFLSIYIPTLKIAPSKEAAEFMFGKRQVRKNKVVLLNNAIDTKVFRFDNNLRKKLRTKLQIENKFVVGHIGRFSYQKNHAFLLDIFKEIRNTKSNAVLVLVGVGELENDIREKAKRNDIVDGIVFLGVRSDIPALLMSFDVMIFPSYYEGMPNVIVEAQATDLKCFISDKISRDVNITGKVDFVSLNHDASYWANKILDFNYDGKRDNTEEIFYSNQYDMKSVSEKFLELVFGG